jgi:hypothetical protein
MRGDTSENMRINSLPLDPVLFMQTGMAELYRKMEGLSVEEFLSLDEKYDILGFIETGYVPFHLTGDQGILDEIRNYVRIKRQADNEQKRQNSI